MALVRLEMYPGGPLALLGSAARAGVFDVRRPTQREALAVAAHCAAASLGLTLADLAETVSALRGAHTPP